MHRIYTKMVDPADLGQVRSVEGHREIARNYAAYLSDESRLAHKGADWVFVPEDESQIVTIFRPAGEASDHLGSENRYQETAMSIIYPDGGLGGPHCKPAHRLLSRSSDQFCRRLNS
jgi:hypothetical protein